MRETAFPGSHTYIAVNAEYLPEASYLLIEFTAFDRTDFDLHIGLPTSPIEYVASYRTDDRGVRALARDIINLKRRLPVFYRSGLENFSLRTTSVRSLAASIRTQAIEESLIRARLREEDELDAAVVTGTMH